MGSRGGGERMALRESRKVDDVPCSGGGGDERSGIGEGRRGSGERRCAARY